ncbi:MAG: protocatechuate 3,4-dioxygenase [Myxococcota bacterium]
MDDSTSGDGGSESSGEGAESTGGDGSSDTSDGSSSSGEPGDCNPADAWAVGGTAAMTAQDCYPDPFAGGAKSCALLCEQIEGPCTSDAPERQDISEGLTGLPVRLALAFVDADTCEPVEGAHVEVWHAQRSGVYSGVTPGGDFCYGDDPSAQKELYFRGSQVTDADGRVDFDTCYPGWYGGRAVHIHFRVVINGVDHLVSQLYFDDALNDEICTTHPEYADRGVPDTTNVTDLIIGSVDDLSPYVFETQRMADGAMLASKLVTIRSSSSEPLCSIEVDAGDMGGMG